MNYLGVDVSKDWIDARLLPSQESWHVDTHPDALTNWAKSLKGKVDLAVLEATGGFEMPVAAALAEQGIAVAIVNPAQVKAYAEALGLRAKTDAISAAVIAQFAQAIKPRPSPLVDAQQAALNELVGRRRQLITALVAERNRLLVARSKAVRKSLQDHIEWLEKQLAKVDDQMTRLIQNSPVWRVHEQLLDDVGGIGPTTARTMVAELPEIGRLSNRKISALVGIVPWDNTSGYTPRKKKTAGGRPGVRAALYMATLSAIRCNPPIRDFYRRLVGRGKPKKLALTACMRKLLIIANAVIRQQILASAVSDSR